MKPTNKQFTAAVVLAGLLVALSMSTSAAQATTTPPDSTVIATEPTEPTEPTGQTEPTEPSPDYPPGFDVMVERIKASGAPEAVKDRILSRVEELKDRSVASPPMLGALGALVERTVEESPLREQIRDQIRLRTKEFGRLMKDNDVTGAREEVRQIVNRYRQEMFLLVQERVHTHLDDLIARLPELADKIDDEMWRATLVGLRNEAQAAESLPELRAVMVDIRSSLVELHKDIEGN